MKRRLPILVVVAAVVAAASGCSAGGGASSAMGTSTQDSTPALSVDGGDSGRDTTGADATEETTFTSTVPPGDGHWHPAPRSVADAPVVPTLVQALMADQPVEAERPFTGSFIAPRPYAVIFDAPCADVASAMTANAEAQKFVIQAQGSTGTANWLVVEDGPLDGANLVFTAGTEPDTCEMDGLPLTPVHLTMTGTTTADYIGTAGVVCGQSELIGGVVTMIFGVPVAPSNTMSVMMATADGTDAGTHRVDGSEDSDGTAMMFDTPVYSYAQLFSDPSQIDADTGMPAGGIALTGSLSLSDGLAAGSLDVSGGGEEISGYFDCGSNPVEPDDTASTGSTTTISPGE